MAGVSDDERARSFGRQAADYERLRPGYPAAAIEALVSGRGLRVVDVGAGTGKLTQALRAAGHTVLAVEPDALMRAEMTARMSDVEVRDGTAEALPVADAEVDAVLFGQSWHWAEPAAAAAEARRVLTEGGVLGLLWNVPDARAGWVRELLRLTHPGQVPRAEARSPVLPGFEPGELVHVDWRQRLTGAELVALAGTWSRVATLPPPARNTLLAAVQGLIVGHSDLRDSNEIEFPYICQAYRFRVTGGLGQSAAPVRG
jgi:SAM-dependent methyltransferase